MSIRLQHANIECSILFYSHDTSQVFCKIFKLYNYNLKCFLNVT